MRRIVVFDFDGTLTTRDTLIEFIRFTYGTERLWRGLLRFLPQLLLMKLRLYPNGRAKERLFSHFFKGWRHKDFLAKGIAFADTIEHFQRNSTVDSLASHMSQGDTVYVISASIEEWVRPWCQRHGVEHVLGTRIEIAPDGRITGRFLSKNCYGQEKVDRLLGAEPDRQSYHLTAYGDSRGDKEMLAFADKGQLV